MPGNMTEDPFTAYQEAAKVMSAKKGSASRTESKDEVIVTGSCRAMAVEVEPSSSSQAKKSKGGGVTTRSSQQSADVAHSVGSLATSLKNQELEEEISALKVASETFKLEMPKLIPLLPRMKALFFGRDSFLSTATRKHDRRSFTAYQEAKVMSAKKGSASRTESKDEVIVTGSCRAMAVEVEPSSSPLPRSPKVVVWTTRSSQQSADAAHSVGSLATSLKNQELEEEISALKVASETFKLEMVMAASGARIIRDPEAQIGIGGLITPLLVHQGISLGNDASGPSFFDLSYLRSAHYFSEDSMGSVFIHT
ncbi:hypothetical protein Bca52824_011384 [Brassica carinata]|uniref:Arabidopsis retrotransposon Orf1 C-terminal domain-containing protein n=1 Tax=Brassica carinata TaxID=52824 RepID=A0A8X7WFB7_BRACI|nr:hypothetical protein Bca52824_011384 [Brassica carinata]